jgi:hypothetical protein
MANEKAKIEPESDQRYSAVQDQYPVIRDSVEVVVPIEGLTAAEMDAICDALSAKGAQCLRHAEQLEQLAGLAWPEREGGAS